MKDTPPKLLIIEDDERFVDVLEAEFRDRGYEVLAVSNLSEFRAVSNAPIDFAIVDLRLRGDYGIDAIPIIKENNPNAKIIVLTGYGSIATAVEATKMGADNYLTKPIDIDTIEHAFGIGEDEETGSEDSEDSLATQTPSLARHEREYIEYILAECGGNISEAARRLGLHRQSLQRKLRKYPPR